MKLTEFCRAHDILCVQTSKYFYVIDEPSFKAVFNSDRAANASLLKMGKRQPIVQNTMGPHWKCCCKIGNSVYLNEPK